eukprot:s7_g37.t1
MQFLNRFISYVLGVLVFFQNQQFARSNSPVAPGGMEHDETPLGEHETEMLPEHHWACEDSQALHSKLDALFDQNQTLLELVNGLKTRWESDVWKDTCGVKVFDMDELLDLRSRTVPKDHAEIECNPMTSQTGDLSLSDFRCASSSQLELCGDESAQEGNRSKKRDSSRYTFVRSKLSAHQKKAEEESIRQRSQYLDNENSIAVEERRSCRDWADLLVSSHYFSFFIMALIFINLILLGIELDVSTSLGQDDIPRWFEIVNFVIVSIFMLELVLKMYARGYRAFFAGDDGGWNVFDSCIVVVSLLESVISSQLELSHLRVMRFARLVKTFRGVRVMRLLHYISALRTLAHSILNTMRSLFWTLVLLLLTFYSFALIFTQAVLDHCRIETVMQTGDPNAVPVCESRLDRYWSNVPQSMLTLFMSITGGLSWIDALEALTNFSVFALSFFVIYIVLTVFAVLNVVTGVFCNTAIESAAVDKEIAAITQLKKHRDLSQSLHEIFDEMDADRSNTITLDEFREALASTKLPHFLESLGIATTDAWALFAFLDSDQSGDIEVEEFVSACLELNGPAKSYQIAQMSRENKVTRRALKQMSTMMADMKAQLEKQSIHPWSLRAE